MIYAGASTLHVKANVKLPVSQYPLVWGEKAAENTLYSIALISLWLNEAEHMQMREATYIMGLVPGPSDGP